MYGLHYCRSSLSGVCEGMDARGGGRRHITGSHLTNETEFTVVLSGICIAALTGVPPAAETGYRLAQPVTPETVYSPTLAGRRSKPRNFNSLFS